MNHPQITSEREVLDTSMFRPGQTDTVLRDGKRFKRIAGTKNYIEDDEDGNLIRDLVRLDSKSNIPSYDYSENLVFGVYKEYSPGGILLVKGGYCWYGFNYGKWFYYNVSGDLDKTIDFDEGYVFTSDDILEFCLEHSISTERKIFGPKTIINKTRTDDGKPAWAIEYDDLGSLSLVDLLIDGRSGKIIRRHISPMPLN
jgi:antitoxin component YwqK of YwqJK toxin-antitoxin module